MKHIVVTIVILPKGVPFQINKSVELLRAKITQSEATKSVFKPINESEPRKYAVDICFYKHEHVIDFVSGLNSFDQSQFDEVIESNCKWMIEQVKYHYAED